MREILVKVEYHGQVWYEVKQITMGKTHGKSIQTGHLPGYGVESSPDVGSRDVREADSP